MFLKVNLFIVALLAFIVYAARGKKIHNDKAFLLFSFLALFFCHALIDINSVPDLPAYENSYKAASMADIRNCFVRGSVYPRFEVGFILFQKICTYVSTNFRFFVVIYSFLLLFLYYQTIRSYSPFVWLSVIIFLLTTYNQSLYVMREHLAIAIVVFSYPFIIKRDLWAYLILMFVAFYVHQSSIIFFPVYFLYGLEKKELVIASVILSIILGASFDIVYYSLGDSTLIVGYETYLGREEGMNLTAVLINVVFVVIFLFLCRKRLFEWGIYKLCAVVGIIDVIASVVGLGFPGMGRAMMYYSSVIIWALPLSINNIKTGPIKVIYLLLFLGIRYYACFLGTSSANIINAKLVGLF